MLWWVASVLRCPVAQSKWRAHVAGLSLFATGLLTCTHPPSTTPPLSHRFRCTSSFKGSRISGFFFFQAEDGIRDYKVTGVQTCALPIWPRVLPRDEDLRRAADVLNAGKRIAVLAGAGALHATDELIAVAERLRCGIAKEIGRASCRERV